MSPPPTPPSQPPVVILKEKRSGCFGCGCGLLLVILLLAALLAGGIGWYAYHKSTALTSADASVVPTYDGGDDMYRGALQKLATFDQANRASQPATLQLSADEINTLLARQPDLAANQVHLFVTLQDGRAQFQASVPTHFIPISLFQGRYLNANLDVTPAFDPATKNLSLTLHRLRLGSSEVPASDLGGMQVQFDALLQLLLQQSPDVQRFLARTESIAIQNGQLVIVTQ